MDTRSFPEALKSIMEQRGWSQTRLAREMDVPQTWISMASRGKRDPSIGRVIRLLASVGWEVVIRPKREEPDPVKRREFHNKIVKLAGGTVAEKAAGITFVPSTKVSPYQNHDYITALADHLNQMRGEQGGARLISTAHGHVQRINLVDVIGGRDRKLQVATAKLIRVHALTLYDADRLNHAEGAAKNALALARASLDPEIQALMHVTLSQVATYAGAGGRGCGYAEKGLKISGISDRSRAELNKRLMRSLAILPGQERSALDAFTGIHSFDERVPGLNLNLGVALSDLGRHKAAIQAFSDAAHHYAESSPHYYAQSLQGEIMSLLHAGIPDVAADRTITLVYVLPLVNSARLQKDVNEVLDASARWIKVPAMRDAREQLKAVAGGSTMIPSNRGDSGIGR